MHRSAFQRDVDHCNPNVPDSTSPPCRRTHPLGPLKQILMKARFLYFVLGVAGSRLIGAETPPVSPPSPGTSTLSAPAAPGSPPAPPSAKPLPPLRPNLWPGAPNLTESQRAAVRSAREENLKVSAPIREKLSRARKDLEDYLFSPTADSAGVKAKVSAIGQYEAELAEHRLAFIARLRPVLNAEQLARLRNNRGEWAERMTGTPPAGTNAASGPTPRPPRLHTIGAPPLTPPPASAPTVPTVPPAPK